MFFWTSVLLIATLLLMFMQVLSLQAGLICVGIAIIAIMLHLGRVAKLSMRIRRIKWKRGYSFGSAFTHLGGMSQVQGLSILMFLSPDQNIIFRDRQAETLIPYNQVQKILIVRGKDVLQMSDAYICQILQVDKKLALGGLREALIRQRHIIRHDILMMVINSPDSMMSDIGELVILAHDRMAFNLKGFKADNELMPKIRYLRLGRNNKSS